MRPRRPKIDTPYGPLDFVLLAFGIVAGVLLIVATAVYWPGLPDEIPTHFNFAGEADARGPKWTLLLLPALGVFMTATMAVLSRLPHIYNYPWKITEKNAPAQYICARRLILALGAEIPWLLLYILWGGVRAARGEAASLGPVVPVIWLVVIAASVVIYFVNAAKAR